MADKQKTMINEALKIARLYWGFTQAQMAEALGLSQAMVSEIERGTKSVTLETLDRYSKVLGIRKSQLLFFAEEMEGEAPIRKGRLIVAEKALRLLDKLKPTEPQDA